MTSFTKSRYQIVYRLGTPLSGWLWISPRKHHASGRGLRYVAVNIGTARYENDEAPAPSQALVPVLPLGVLIIPSQSVWGKYRA